MWPLSRAAYLDATKEFDLLDTGRMQQPEKTVDSYAYDEKLQSPFSHSLQNLRHWLRLWMKEMSNIFWNWKQGINI